jgi:two-component system cell cycle sensor histidine kinase/response regulator CckA
MAQYRRKVLVVDDDEAVRALAGRVLTREGYEVLEARDGRTALDAARAAGGDLVLLTDVVLPGMNGAELAAELRSRSPDVPVIYMSGFGELELEALGIHEVGAAYLTKPFTPEVLTLMVEGVVAE